MSSLGKLWEEQYVNNDNELSKEAAAHGMSTDQYLQSIANNAASEEEIAKEAAETELAEGMLAAKGIGEGIAHEFNKMARAGGDAAACSLLKSVFVNT